MQLRQQSNYQIPSKHEAVNISDQEEKDENNGDQEGSKADQEESKTDQEGSKADQEGSKTDQVGSKTYQGALCPNCKGIGGCLDGQTVVYAFTGYTFISYYEI